MKEMAFITAAYLMGLIACILASNLKFSSEHENALHPFWQQIVPPRGALKPNEDQGGPKWKNTNEIPLNAPQMKTESVDFKNKPDVKVVFSLPANKRRYMKLDGKAFGDMSNFTICYWIKFYDLKHKNTIFSYSTVDEPDTINIWIANLDLKTDKVFITMEIFGGAAKIQAYYPILYVGVWRHVCHGWSKDSFSDAFLTLNGNAVSDAHVTGPDLQGKAKWTIPGQGIGILGQDQDIHGGAFDSDEALIGELFDFQMWDRLLSAADINKLSGCDDNINGNVVRWMDTEMYARGGVQLHHTFQCSGL